MILSTVVGYYILRSLRPVNQDHGKKQKDADFQSGVSDLDELDTALHSACEFGDHAAVVACWNAFKLYGQAPIVHLSQVVTAMRVCRKHAKSIANELLNFFQKYPTECSMAAINGILDSLGKQLDAELATQVVDILPSLQLSLNHLSYEILIAMHVRTRTYSEAQRLLADMESNDFPHTVRLVFLALTVALNMRDYAEAMRHLRSLKASWQGSGATDALLPKAVMAQLIGLGCKEGHMGMLLLELEGMPLLEEAIDCVPMDCATANALLDAAQNCGRVDIVEHLELLASSRPVALRCQMLCQLCAKRAPQIVFASCEYLCRLNAVIAKWVVLVF